jgi:hypothetical protein
MSESDIDDFAKFLADLRTDINTLRLELEEIRKRLAKLESSVLNFVGVYAVLHCAKNPIRHL